MHEHLQLSDGSAIEEEEKSEVNGDDVNGFEEKNKSKSKPPPTQFQEPDANSLLDAFGF